MRIGSAIFSPRCIPLMVFSMMLISNAYHARAQEAATASTHAAQSIHSTCDGSTTAPQLRVRLILRHMAWSKWPSLCTDLFRALDLSPAHAAESLRATGYFHTATCTSSSPSSTSSTSSTPSQPNNVDVICELTPQPMVRSVKITGHVPFPLLRNDIERRLFLRPGTLLSAVDADDDPIQRQKERLQAYLVNEGFFDTTVTIQHTPVTGAEPNQGIAIEVHLAGGTSYHLGDVILTGDPTSLTPKEARRALSHNWLPYLFNKPIAPVTLRDDAHKIETMLHTRGWPEARVTSTFAVNPNTQRIDITLAIHSGPRTTTTFSGNHTLSTSRLTPLLTFAQASAVDAVEIERTRRNIVEALQKKGHYAAHVTAQANTSEKDVITIAYVIDEGPKAPITTIGFVGNASFPSGVLHEQADLLTRTHGVINSGYWVDSWVARDERAIRALYAKHGYANTTVRAQRDVITVKETQQLRVTFVITEDTPQRVANVTFTDLPLPLQPNTVRAQLPLAPGDPFTEAATQGAQDALRAILAAQGYLQSTIALQTTLDANHQVHLHYTITPGPCARYGGILLRGNFRTSSSLLRQQLRLTPDQPIDAVHVALGERDLRGLGIFHSVQIRPLRTHPSGETWLLGALEERDVITLDAVAGFTTDDRFSLGADFRDRSLFGRAWNTAVRLRLGNADSYITPALHIGRRDSLSFTLSAPRPWGLPFNVQYSASYDRQNKPLFDQTQFGGSLALQRTLFNRNACAYCPDISGSTGYDLGATQFRSTAPQLANQQINATIGRVFVSADADRTDSPVDPRRGYRFHSRLELASRYLAANVANASSFWRMVHKVGGYLPLGTPLPIRGDDNEQLGGPVVVAAALGYSMGQPFDRSTQLPPSEAFYYGGDMSVRGIKERASTVAFPTARYLATANVELRWYFVQNLSFGSFQLAGFADAGTVSNSAKQLFNAVTVSVGTVLRYVTPIGPLSIAYGWPVVIPAALVRADPSAATNTGRLHIMFGAAF